MNEHERVPGQERGEGSAWSPDVAVLVARIVSELGQASEQLVSLMLADMADQLPRGRVLAVDADVDRTLRAALRLFFVLLAEGRDLGADEVAALERTGTAQAARGIALEEVKASVRAWMSRAWKAVAEPIVEEPASPATVRALTEIGAWATRLERAALDAIARGHRRAGPELPAEASTFVEALVAGSFASAADAVAAAATFGCDLTAPHGLLLVIPRDGRDERAAERVDRAVADLVGRVPSSLAGSVNEVPQMHAVVLAPAPSPAHWDEALAAAADAGSAHSIAMFVTRPAAGAEAISAAYGDAARMVVLVAARACPRPVISRHDLFVRRTFDGLSPDLLGELERDIVDRLLALCDRDFRRLVETLRAYFQADRNTFSTSKAMGTARQTVTDRIEKVERLTGLSAQEHHLQFELVLHHPALVARLNHQREVAK